MEIITIEKSKTTRKQMKKLDNNSVKVISQELNLTTNRWFTYSEKIITSDEIDKALYLLNIRP